LNKVISPVHQPDLATKSAVMKSKILWLLFLRVLVVSLLLGTSVLLQTKGPELILPPLRYLIYFSIGVYTVSVASALLLRFVWRYNRFAFAQIGVDAALVTILVYFTGCSQSIFAIIYFLPIIAGSAILYRKGGLFFAALTSVGYGTVLTLENLDRYPLFFHGFGFIPDKEGLALMNLFAIHGLTFFLVAFFSSFVSERLRRTESQLSETTESYDRLASLYRQIFEDISTGIITVDIQGRITSFNRASEEITGYPAAEILGQRMAENFPNLVLERPKNSRLEAELVRKNGERFPIGYSSARLNSPDGRENGCVITIQDLSQIKKMEAQVRQAEKLAAIGEMAAGIAHEFRNPLTAISGAAQIFQEELTGHPAYQPLLTIMLRECDRLNGTISEFLQFSKPTIPEKSWVALPRLVKESVELLAKGADLKASQRIIMDVPGTTELWGDERQIKQVLLNLIDNGLHALADQQEGAIRIGAGEEVDADGRERLVLTVNDNGPGIPESYIDKVFDPFFTTRDNGTGLGLAIVHQIVACHGGAIRVSSPPGKGTTFTVVLPLPG